MERYSHDDNQSWVRYKDIDGWNTQFLHKALDNMLPTLRSGGKLCINISDVYANSKWSSNRCWLKICDPMNEFLDEYRDMEYVGCIGMEMAKRPNCIGVGNAVESGESNREPDMIKRFEGRFCEPIWIWEKK